MAGETRLVYGYYNVKINSDKTPRTINVEGKEYYFEHILYHAGVGAWECEGLIAKGNRKKERNK